MTTEGSVSMKRTDVDDEKRHSSKSQTKITEMRKYTMGSKFIIQCKRELSEPEDKATEANIKCEK